MTAPLDPNQTFTYWLPEDAGLPEAQRRGLVLRYMSAREWLTFSQRYEAVKDKPLAEQLAAMAELVGMCAVGLKHPTVQWTGPDSLLDAFSDLTLIWLCGGELHEACSLSEIERKKSAWQSQSSSANSAPTASPPTSAQSQPAVAAGASTS